MTRSKIWRTLLLILIACSSTQAISFFAKIAPNKGNATNVVKIDDHLSFQAIATPNGNDVRFQVKITCKGCVKQTGVELSKVNPGHGLGRYDTPEEEIRAEQERKRRESGQPVDWSIAFRVCPCVEDYPSAPKVATTRKGDTITADFTVPAEMINDDSLAFVFTIKDPSWCCSYSGFYALLKEFLPK